MSIGTSAAISLGVAAGTAGAGVYGAHRSSQAAERGAQLQTSSANLGAKLQTGAADRQLAFLREQDARQNTQYLDEQRYARDQDAYARQMAEQEIARREPFRQISLGALRQLQTPINQSRTPLYEAPTRLGTLADVVR